MSRTKSSKRKRNAQDYVSNKASKQSSATNPFNAATLPSDTNLDETKHIYEPKSLQTLISEEELDITVETLKTLTKYPSAIKAKCAKELRAAIYDFRMACTTGTNNAGGEFLAHFHILNSMRRTVGD
jgi:hypothetical protein